MQLDYLASLNGLSRNSNVRVGQRLKLTGDVPPVETAKVDTAKSAAKPVAAGKILKSIRLKLASRYIRLQAVQVFQFVNLLK